MRRIFITLLNYQSCLKIVSWIYTFHMPLFFFLSGAALGFWRCIESGHLWFLLALFWDMVIFVALFKVLQRIHMQKVVLVIALIMQCTCYLIFKDILSLISGLEMIFWFHTMG